MAFTQADKTELAQLEKEFERAGGRGVELAERIDALRAQERLEELRLAVQAKSISYSEVLELQDLAEHIAEDDEELLQWVGESEDDTEASNEEYERLRRTDSGLDNDSEPDAVYGK